MVKKYYKKLSRRSFLKYTTAGFIVSTLPSLRVRAAVNLQAVESLPQNITRTWLGHSFWANRLQDWRLHQGRIECLVGGAGDQVRTVSILTRELISGATSAQMSVVSRLLADQGGGGFCGFLIGAGSGKLDHRAAALVQKASGIGGGLLCTYETDGCVRFREHTSEQKPLKFAVLSSDQVGTTNPPVAINVDILLRLDISRQPDGNLQLKLTASHNQTGKVFGQAILRNVAKSLVRGGISLVSSPYSGKAGARYGFRGLRTGGAGIAMLPQHAIGPILGTMYSLNGKVLKLSAQFMPIGDTELQKAKFQYRKATGAWQDGPIATIEAGYTAVFRLANWDSTQDWEYRVAYNFNTSAPHYYSGIIRKDPIGKKSLTIALFSCTIAAARNLEGGVGKPELPNAELLGRYTPKNLYFPHRQLVQNASRHKPDLLLFVGDQLYEGNPTRKDTSSSPVLDYLYKWYLWIWSFREMTRSTPTIVAVDDHDVYQANIWGENGKPAHSGNEKLGGYTCSASFVNLVQRTHCAHNPDAYDPTPVMQNISVYYSAFRYGGVSFAVLEDRKFKTAPTTNPSVLLGERQERFLQAWAQDQHDMKAKVCITQTSFACIKTEVDGTPSMDYDSNGFPKPGRDRAISLLRDAGALVVAGDQHLASLVRHGVHTFTDGVVQFSGPAGSTLFQRWFQPTGVVKNAEATPHTGDFVDGFGNKMRVLAVANPKVTQRYYVDNRLLNKSNNLGDRRLKSEGYGIIRVNAHDYVIECWPWNVNPTTVGAKQFAGWPYRLPFTQV